MYARILILLPSRTGTSESVSVHVGGEGRWRWANLERLKLAMPLRCCSREDGDCFAGWDGELRWTAGSGFGEGGSELGMEGRPGGGSGDHCGE